jgi:hypothetical protein
VYDDSDPENPVYSYSNYSINTGVYTRCDGASESYVVGPVVGTEDDTSYLTTGGANAHTACVRGAGSPSCVG